MMRRYLFAGMALAVPLLCATAGGVSAGPTLIPEYDVETPLTRPIETVDDFRARLSIGIYEDPRLASPQRLREIIKALDLRTPLGRPITDLLIDPASGDFVGIDAGAIELVGTLPDGSLIVSTRDAGGQFTKAAADRLVWARPDGEPVCFDLVDVDQADVKMAFALLLDRSGSMANVMTDVLATTRTFLDLLPGNAQCTVVSFAETWQVPASTACGAVRLPRTIRAGGDTDIYGPLSTFYRQYSAPAYDGWQKAVIVITDGVITKNADRADRLKAELVKQKGAVKTFVFWLGDHRERHLAGLADYFIASPGAVKATLAGVYGAIVEAYAKQQVLKPKACTP